MYMGYSRPNSPATFLSASSMRLRFSGREKSRNGSFTNSETCGFVSAVAMSVLLIVQFYCVACQAHKVRKGMARETRRYKRAWEYPHTPGDLDGCEKKGVAGKGIRTARRSGQANMKATCGGKQTAGMVAPPSWGVCVRVASKGLTRRGVYKSGKQRTYRTTFLRLGATESA